MRSWRIIPSMCVVSAALMWGVRLHQGMGMTPEIAALVQGPGAIELWQARKGGLGQKRSAFKESPLVVQARVYAELLTPPRPSSARSAGFTGSGVPAAKPEVADVTPRGLATPRTVSPTFNVHATSVFARRPEKSMALISEPGKGISWIRPGDVVGYLKVIEIRRDAVVYAFKKTTGQVAWEPTSIPRAQPSQVSAQSMAMDLQNSPAAPTPPPAPASRPRPSRLGAPQTQPTQTVFPRPRRGGR